MIAQGTISRRPFIVPLIVGCAQFMHQFDGSVITTALPAMARSLGEDPLRLNLAITCYLLALAVFVPVSSWLSDKVGSKRIFMTAIVTFSLSSLLCGLSHNLAELVVARTLQGIGGAMMTPVGRIIVTKSVPKSELIQAMNYVTIPALLGPILGPSVGGFIVTYFSWQWIFFINLPIGALGVALVFFIIPDMRETDVPAFDVKGFVLVGFAVAAMILGFEAMGRGLFPASGVAVLIAAGMSCGIGYIFHARRKSGPIIDLSLLKIRTFSASIWGGALVYIGATSQVFLLALLLQLGFGFTPFQSGLTTLATAAGSVLIKSLVRPVVRLFGVRRLLIYNTALTAAYVFVCGLFRVDTPYIVILLTLLISGLSRSVEFTAIQALGYADLPPALTARATGFSSMAQQVWLSFGVGLVALIMQIAREWHGHATIAPNDISPAYFTIAFLSLLAAGVFARLPRNAGAALELR
ncbi:MAG TPA: DHA2 family efflux MFS transporter permease subunit [Stellaceae bacterium]|nr:DHA2 family efflux MFS transporter permease subunit [Stellaceae bacterium]